MSEFRELVKSIAKSREYVRDFYVYGFKSREDFDRKSSRTYDNERRRIESWLAPYIKSEYNGPVKNVFLSLNTNKLSSNPLYRIFETKSFTDNDIMLHFYLLDILKGGDSMTADELTDEILTRFDTNIEVQLVRKKANEYASEGILCSRKQGKKLYYYLAPDIMISDQTAFELDMATSFFQLDAPVGFPGYSLLHRRSLSNQLFIVKHGYFVHALEEEILTKLLSAMQEKREVSLKIQSTKARLQQQVQIKQNAKVRPQQQVQINQSTKARPQHQVQIIQAFPLRIFVSTRTGRRFLCIYLPLKHRLSTVRLDHVKEVIPGEEISDYTVYQDALDRNISMCFGVSFDGGRQMDTVKMTLQIMETHEQFILRRLETEGRGGIIKRIADNTYTYEISVFDGNEMMPWIKTFIGRIIAFESNNRQLQTKFHRDIAQMMRMYGISDTEEE